MFMFKSYLKILIEKSQFKLDRLHKVKLVVSLKKNKSLDASCKNRQVAKKSNLSLASKINNLQSICQNYRSFKLKYG